MACCTDGVPATSAEAACGDVVAEQGGELVARDFLATVAQVVVPEDEPGAIDADFACFDGGGVECWEGWDFELGARGRGLGRDVVCYLLPVALTVQATERNCLYYQQFQSAERARGVQRAAAPLRVVGVQQQAQRQQRHLCGVG